MACGPRVAGSHTVLYGGMLWRKKNNAQESPTAGSPGINEKGNSDEIQPFSNSNSPPPPSTSCNETAVTKLATERADMQHFQLLKWNACAFWSWDVMHDTCVICRNAMMSPCEYYNCKASWLTVLQNLNIYR